MRHPSFFIRALIIALMGSLSPFTAASSQVFDPLDEATTIELVNELADAHEELDICFGWFVQINSTVFSGSNLGRQTSVTNNANCPSYVELQIEMVYTNASSESEDSARFRVATNRDDFKIFNSDLERAAGITESSFLGDNDDVALVRATLALPLLVGEQLAIAGQDVDFATADSANTTADRVNSSPGNDWLRANRMLLVLMGVLGLLFGIFIAYAISMQTRGAS
jgi:hypothetical protein